MGAFADSSTPDPVVSTLTLPDGGERVVWRWGVGRPLLVIQGMSGTHDHWGPQLVEQLLADGRSIVCVNHRGVYGTARPEPGYAITDLADDQAAALDVLGIDEPIDVFGISMGGMTAMELTLRHPEKVRTLGLGCTTAGGAFMTQPNPADIQRLFEAQQSGDKDLAFRAGFEVNFSEKWWTDEALVQEFLRLSLLAPVPLSVVMSQLQAIGQHDVGARLGEISVPTAVMHGTVDRMLPFPNATPIHEGIAGATLDVFEDAGHLYFWEEPLRVAAILEQLSTRSSERSPSTTA
ncbi:MAG: alpha/beta fold hydrolase [Solirubrobacteraceae bacterium]|nr:alpha/beta fold hydrolase [Patulibacter sp.]